ncbi:hypothetical protein, partial [Acidithiobacillus sp.]|uniref:hypothetical protein n=1 Tax=Acidithiobacillus sp. TaxID=1872118 RepID=UPI0023111A70
FYLLPPISNFLVLRHVHPSSLNAGQDRSGHKISEGGLLGRLHITGKQFIPFYFGGDMRRTEASY